MIPEIDFTIFQSINMAIAAGISIFVCLFMIGKLLFTWPLLDSRLESIQANYSPFNRLYVKKNLGTQFFQSRRKTQKKRNSIKKRIVDLFIKKPLFGEDNLKTSFEQAGWSTKGDFQFLFLSSRLICFLLGLGIGYTIISTRALLTDNTFGIKVIILSLAALSGWLVPDLYLRSIIKNRVKMIERQFPDTLDLIIICLQAGLSLNRAIERVAKETTKFSKEIAHELMITTIELEIMLDSRHALQNLYTRVPSAIIRTFTTTLLQSIQQGTPTLQALDILSKEIRNSRMQEAEAKAARLPSLMVIPLVVFVMPNLFIVLLGPAIVRLLNVT